MPVIVVTRLRLSDPAFFDGFFASAVAVVEQATSAKGNIATDVLAEANNTYWTRTAWEERDSMYAFVRSDPHRTTMGSISSWCDEATFVDWDQPGAELPDWQHGYERLLAEGHVASLTSPSSAHHTRDFPAPIVSP
ncbi:MAG: antibiotic biosynthesis monooxygenase [Acidimicrobiales bacterium]